MEIDYAQRQNDKEFSVFNCEVSHNVEIIKGEIEVPYVPFGAIASANELHRKIKCEDSDTKEEVENEDPFHYVPEK